jgi:hypothetical protein
VLGDLPRLVVKDVPTVVFSHNSVSWFTESSFSRICRAWPGPGGPQGRIVGLHGLDRGPGGKPEIALLVGALLGDVLSGAPGRLCVVLYSGALDSKRPARSVRKGPDSTMVTRIPRGGTSCARTGRSR